MCCFTLIRVHIIFSFSVFFPFFALKHKLWVFVRTASLSRFLRVSTITALRKHKNRGGGGEYCKLQLL